jgi:hypothetical protein
MTPQTYFFLQTADGSPSLRFHLDPIDEHGRKSESMHSHRGAFSETAYIYGSAVETTLRNGLAPRFFSLGLGLGYNELLTTALVLKYSKPEFGRDLFGVYGESFEAVPELNSLFAAWVSGTDVRADFQAAYDFILQACAQHTGLEAPEIREQLASWIKNGQWLLRSALTHQSEFSSQFSCFLFDAFSSKTSPELWDEPFLDRLFATLPGPQAVLSTYACTGALKRTLRANGFTLDIREGFASKRDSTFALKGVASV